MTPLRNKAFLSASMAAAAYIAVWVVIYFDGQAGFTAQRSQPHYQLMHVAGVFLIVLPVVGAGCSVVQLRRGSSETWRAMALLPLAFHFIGICIGILLLAGAGIVAP